MVLGPVMMGVSGVALTPEERDQLKHPAVGGVILFTRNYENNEQLRALVRSIKDIRHPRLIVAVDHEGRRVQRFREGFTPLPSASMIGERYNRNAGEGERAAGEVAWLMATELLQHGVDISFAPVLDIDYGGSGLLRDRTFHRTPKAIARLGNAWMRGMHEAGMAATGKHFPGHGWVRGDSHFEKPVDSRPLDKVMHDDAGPYRTLIANGLESVMPSHVIYDQVDPMPAGYSRRWLNDILRRQLGFQGVIVCDDLGMVGANMDCGFVERARMALDAGCDMLLLCNLPEEVPPVLESLEDYTNPAAQIRLTRLHGRPPKAVDEKRLAAARDLAMHLFDNTNLEMNV